MVPSFRGGGAEGANVRLANELVRRDVAVDLVVLQARGPWRQAVSARVAVVDLAAPRAARSLLPLAAYLRQRRPPVIMAGPSHVSVVSLLAAKLAGGGSAVMTLEHNDILAQSRQAAPLKDRALPVFLRLVYPLADQLLAVSAGAAASLARLLNVPAGRVGVLYNGLDLRQVAADAAQPIDHPWLRQEAVPTLVAIGRLAPQKGFPDLLRALASLVGAIPARLLVLGEGPEQANLEALVAELGLADRVQFLGYRPSPHAYLARASAFVQASRFEGFGIAILEALACGTPVVATDCPSGPAEILEDGRYGLLVPPGDPPALADALRRVLGDPVLRARLKAAGPARASDFSIERAGDQFLAFAAEARKRRGAAGR